MRILILGAYGLIGSVITARLLADGHDVIGVGRDVSAAARRQPAATWIRADLATSSTADWRARLEGVDAVVNAAGALQDGAGDDLAGVHLRGVLALAEAAREAGVRRFVQISAVGADFGSPLPFLRTKGQAEEALKALDLDWVILRPAFVLAAQAFGGSALLRGLAAFPGLIPAVDAGSVVQVVSAEDVAEAVARSVLPDGPSRIVCDLAAEGETSLGGILIALRGWLGLKPAPLVNFPAGLGHLAALGADALSLLGWRSPLRTTALAQLAGGVRGRDEDCPSTFGFTPWSLEETLSARPAGVQDRWFSRLYFAGPLALTTLALFWLASGLIGLARIDAAADVLIQAGLAPDVSRGFVIAGGIADITLGLAALHRGSARWALKGMIAVTLAYLAGATLWRPDLWADPLGVLVKTLPAALLAGITLALLDAR